MMDDKTRGFTHKEIAEILIKKLDIHEGIWGIYVEFAMAGINAGPSDDQLMPTAMVAVKTIGLQRFAKETGLSIDAAKVNPVRSGKKQKGSLSQRKP